MSALLGATVTGEGWACHLFVILNFFIPLVAITFTFVSPPQSRPFWLGFAIASGFFVLLFLLNDEQFSMFSKDISEMITSGLQFPTEEDRSIHSYYIQPVIRAAVAPIAGIVVGLTAQVFARVRQNSTPDNT